MTDRARPTVRILKVAVDCGLLLVGAFIIWQQTVNHPDCLWPLLTCALGGFIIRGVGDRLFREN